MILILLATILILAIAFYQATQGFFNAMIMTILTLLSATVAFNYYEPLANLFREQLPAAAEGISLLAIFIVLLGGLRFALDAALKDNVVTGVWINRIGGGLMGLLTGILLVGVLTVGMQMLPWGPSILGYAPYQASLRPGTGLLPFRPDEFVVGTLSRLSATSLGGADTRKFGDAHDNLRLELFCNRNTAGAHGRTDAANDSLMVGAVYVSDGLAWGRDVPLNPRLGEGMITKAILVRTTVDDSATDKDGWWRLPGTHFRLICEGTRNGKKVYHSRYPVGYMARSSRGLMCVPAPREDGQLLPARLLVQRSSDERRTLMVDWVYRIPVDEEPTKLVFRRVSQAVVSEPRDTTPHLPGALEIAEEDSETTP